MAPPPTSQNAAARTPLRKASQYLALWPGIVLLAFPAQRLPGSDVSFYGVVKSAQYHQTNESAPYLPTNNAFAFDAFVVASTNNVVTNATVKPSNSTPTRTLLANSNGYSLTFEERFDSQSAIDATYPTTSGGAVNYTTTMYTVHDGTQSGSVSFYLLFFPLSYPTTPQIMNVAAAQSIDSTRDYQVSWDSLGGSTIAIVQLTVVDAVSNLVWTSPAPFSAGALNGASTSTVIPAYSLPPGAALQGHLTIANPGNPNTNSYAGATGVAALAKDTQFAVTTRPAPARPQLTILPHNAGQFQLRVSGETNRLYQVQASQDLRTWTNLYTTNSANSIFDFTDSQSSTTSARLYRAKVGQ